MTTTPVGPLSAARDAAAACGYARRPGWTLPDVTGRDALDLFQRLSTNDVARLGEGRAVTTLFLSPMGRIVHRALLVRAPHGLRALVEPSPTPFPAWIDRYTFGEDARVLTTGSALLFAGGECARALGLPSGSPALTVTTLASGAWAARRDLGPVPAFLVVGAQDELEALVSSARAAGALEIDEDTRLQLRVTCGVPEGGAELTEDYHPLEAGLIDDVSFTKGCYVGQEVVARQDTYGKVTRRLVGLVFEGAPAAGELLSEEGKDGCRVTSVTPEAQPDDPGPTCLGYVRAKTALPGREVTTASGRRGRIVALPRQPAALVTG